MGKLQVCEQRSDEGNAKGPFIFQGKRFTETFTFTTSGSAFFNSVSASCRDSILVLSVSIPAISNGTVYISCISFNWACVPNNTTESGSTEILLMLKPGAELPDVLTFTGRSLLTIASR